MKKITLLLFCIWFCQWHAFAQRISLTGNVFSFKGEKVALLRKAQKNVSFDGPLERTSVVLKGENGTTSYTTGLNGWFTVAMENPGKYTLSIYKNGYCTLNTAIHYIGTGAKNRFESLFFLLKQDESATIQLGTLEINNGNMTFTANTKEKSNNDIVESNIHLLQKATFINKAGGGGYTSKADTKNETKQTKTDTVKNSIQPNEILRFVSRLSNGNLDSLKTKLVLAKQILSKLSPESADYKSLREQIEIAEQKIKDKEAIIAYQKNEISQANKIIVFISLLAFALLLLAALLFYFWKQRKRHALILKEKNTNIQKINNKLLSSINYASLIQQRFLREKVDLKKLFNNSFIYTSPKDILSGDFYWFTHTNGHRIVVVADCTGHGVPGAMLTVLGHSMLEDIVNIKGETVPSKILYALNKGLQKTFNSNNEHLEYGMDIAVISIKDNSNEMLLAGINNGIYRLRNGAIQYFDVSNVPMGYDLQEKDFKETRIDVAQDDVYFLFSDGYLDQFSSNQQKVVKFNVPRFEKLLGQIGQNSFDSAESTLTQTLHEWKGEREQIDDICVLGLKI